ncbi:MAG: hypothetical protein EBR82_24695 [Caulobacteraceae bacterium]|nr:hypothetical protein [Caulobacteraceae bacterium]
MQGFVIAPFNVFSALALVTLALFGGRVERAGAVLFAAVLLLTPLIDGLTVGSYRWAVALSSLALFGVLLWGALTRERWWLIFAAGCQLMALSTHMVALLRVDSLQWTMVSIRWFSWLFMMTIALFGAWEGWALSRIARRRPPPA